MNGWVIGWVKGLEEPALILTDTEADSRNAGGREGDLVYSRVIW